MRLFVCFIFAFFSLTASVPATRAAAPVTSPLASRVDAFQSHVSSQEVPAEASEESNGTPAPVEELGVQDHLLAPDDTLWLPMLVSIGKHGLKLHEYASPHPEIQVPPANGR